MLRRQRTLELDLPTLYEILRLRAEVFVVEQACPYLDVDGRDLEPTCEQLWVSTPDRVVAACARLLDEPAGGKRLGRICTAASARGAGLAATLIREAITASASQSITIDAQSHLADWYSTFGFVATGHEFVEDGIPHTEMVRAGG